MMACGAISRCDDLSQSPSTFRFHAHNSAADSENKIHDDRVAPAYGFRGGLVPGVTIYGYMVPAIVARFGNDWLAHGRISVRFVAPCYEGDAVVTRCDGLTVAAEQEDGSLYASGVVSVGQPTDRAVNTYPAYPVPEMDERPNASPETVAPGRPLGSICETLDVQVGSAIPERLLRMANEILTRNFRLSPWIHAASDVDHHRLAACGQRITVTGMIQEHFERKGRRFGVAGIAMTADDDDSGVLPVASVRHTFIYKL